MDDTHNGNDDQDECQKRRQIAAHTVHDVILIFNKEEAYNEIYDDQRNERCSRHIALYAELDSRGARPGNGNEGAHKHQGRQQDIIRILADMIRNGMDIAVQPDDNQGEYRKEDTGKRQAGQAGKYSRAAIEAQLGRENEVACPEVSSKESKTEDENIENLDTAVTGRRIAAHHTYLLIIPIRPFRLPGRAGDTRKRNL